MKLSLNWIKDYVDLPESVDMTKLAYDLTMSTVEVEGAEPLAPKFDKLVVGIIKEISAHPNADKLRVCQVDIGDSVQQIVCGGSNLYVGMRVAVSLPGSVVRWHGQGEPVEIKKSKLRGVESYGMICASTEIGIEELFPLGDEDEVVDLKDFDFPAGTPLATALDMDDVIIEIDNKSMTNRPDLWGHYGIARELAALYDLPLRKFESFNPDVTGNFTVEIKDSDRCPRYIGVEMNGVSVKPSPYKMQNRLFKVGLRPINALVDITNYVMMAVGQPTHAFDADMINGHITVRRAEAGEKLGLLNGKDLALSEDDLVIADSKEPVALAGVMGGAKDSILPTTNRIILEIANFEAAGIRRAALRYDNRTEASARYEKALDPERCDLALPLAIELLRELYPDVKITGFCDRYEKKLSRSELDVSLNWLERRLGRHIPNETIAAQLGRLGFDVAFDGDNMHLAAPTWRSTGDISIKADIMEEIARMFGYENFEPAPITTSFSGAINQLDFDLVRKIKEYLAFRCNMQEIFTYPWMKDQYANAVLSDLSHTMKLSTPPAPDESLIRSSLLPNLCEAVAKNERYYNEFAIFEEAQVISDASFTSKYDARELLPDQRRYIAGAFVGDYKKLTELFRTAKGVIEYMPRFTHMESYRLVKNEKPFWADDTVWLNIVLGDRIIGNLALLSKKASMSCGIKNVASILFEIDTTALKPFTSRTNKFEHLPEYPFVDYDISLLFDSSATWESIDRTLKSLIRRDPLLHGASFVDEYRGKQIPDGKKSVTIKLSIGSLEKTLTSQEIEKCANNVVDKLARQSGAEVRTK